MNIAQEIFRQLGGNRFSVMTGSKNYTSIGNGLQFSLPKRYNGINKISITLEGDDTYTVRGYYFSKSKLTCDMVSACWFILVLVTTFTIIPYT